jgi:integrase/recombinase XerD
MPISNYIQKFTKNLKSDGKSSSTIIAYKKDIEQFVEFIQNKNIEEISQKDIEKFVKYQIKEKGIGMKTASRKINSIGNFFRFALHKKIVKKNPAVGIKHPESSEERLPHCLSQIEYKAIRDTASTNFRLFALIEILLQTGTKIGEISRLKLNDVTVMPEGSRFLITAYQSNPARMIDLNSKADKVLRKYMEIRKARPNDKGYLFNTRTGKNMIIRNIRTAVNRIFKQAGVKDARVNDIRNTFICHQIENGVSLKTIAKYVGHKRTLSTEKYLEVTERKTPGTGTELFEL